MRAAADVVAEVAEADDDDDAASGTWLDAAPLTGLAAALGLNLDLGLLANGLRVKKSTSSSMLVRSRVEGEAATLEVCG